MYYIYNSKFEQFYKKYVDQGETWTCVFNDSFPFFSVEDALKTRHQLANKSGTPIFDYHVFSEQ